MDSRLFFVGIPIGCLIGMMTGFYVLLLLKDATLAHPYARYSWIETIFGRRPASGIRLAARITSLPALWFGGFFFGRWLSRIADLGLDWEELLPVYLVSLAITFIAIVAFPLIRLIVQVGRDFR